MSGRERIKAIILVARADFIGESNDTSRSYQTQPGLFSLIVNPFALDHNPKLIWTSVAIDPSRQPETSIRLLVKNRHPNAAHQVKKVAIIVKRIVKQVLKNEDLDEAVIFSFS